ncbi:MAG: type ISP restriction/modification enzyme [Chloroflexia bacterium]
MPIQTKQPPAITAYYRRLEEIAQHGASNEGATRDAFQTLLAEWGRPHGLTMLAEQTITGTRKRPIRLDGVLVDQLRLHRGIWEAKDAGDDLTAEITRKIAAGYPLTNTLFENTRRAVLYQEGRVVYDGDLSNPITLRTLLDTFVEYSPAQIEEFHRAVARFKEAIPALAASLTTLIEEAKTKNARFSTALDSFLSMCRAALNPTTTQAEVEDMLKQHILTERIFRSIFQNADFVRRNAVAAELEKMVDALTSRDFSRDAFLRSLDYFYSPIEETARTIEDYQEKQDLLKALYEQFFQAYSVRAADTHGIVYTPHEIVAWMVQSVEQALRQEFGLSLGAPDVHIIDPCVGTGTFIMEILRRIPATTLNAKYGEELHANEVLLLPYYIAAQNIEHAYYERTGGYAPFEGLCFTDTLGLAETGQTEMFAEENTERVERQKAAPIFVVIGNPPYNIGQLNENDNNKNRKYPTVDARIRATYGKSSRATLQNKLYDMYVRFFRWATDRLRNGDGIVCFVSNNSFLEQVAFDGMRKQLMQDFTSIYTFDLGGNVRKNPKLSGTTHNVFGIQVGVTITLLIRSSQQSTHELYYARVDEFWKKGQKLNQLTELGDYTCVPWQRLTPDDRGAWLTEGFLADFATFIPLGTRETRNTKSLDVESVFKSYGPGVLTGRDPWVYDFHAGTLGERIEVFIEAYNEQVSKWRRLDDRQASVDDFVTYDEKRMKWSRNLKRDLRRGQFAGFSSEAIRRSLYRPFTQKFLYYADYLVDERGPIGAFFPTPASEEENGLICVSALGHRAGFTALITNLIPNYSLNSTDGFQCFPFYTYNEAGTERRENITDWALAQFRTHYAGASVTKRDIFHYVYAVLHAPGYRTAYAENLKRDLPRIPFVPAQSFRAYVDAGTTLAHLHRDYATLQPYPLEVQETGRVSWRVDERGMRLSADRSALRYNPTLTLSGIPPAAFDYRLGNRSALEWVIDQYRVTTDARSGLRHDPNNPDDEQAIVRLVGQVVRVSLDTQSVIAALPRLD